MTESYDRIAGFASASSVHRICVATLLAVLTFVAYGGSINNGFIWDDETLVVTNRWVKDLSLWNDYFTRPDAISSDRLIAKTYRPLQTLSLALDQKIWNGSPAGFHLTSLLIQVAVCLAVYFLFLDVVGVLPSLCAAVLFATHPALSEAVLCLANRGGHLSALFGLIAAGLFLRVRKPFDSRHVLAIIASGLALLAKEPAIALVALLPIVQGALGRPWPLGPRGWILLHAPFLLVAVSYLGIRRTVVGSMAVAPFWGGSLTATIQLQAKVFAVYLRLLVWPFHLQGRYSIERLNPFPDVAVIGAIALSAGLITLSIVGLRRPGAVRLFSLAILWFYVALLPVSNLIPIPGSMLGERFIYFPVAGSLPLIAGALAAIPVRRFASFLIPVAAVTLVSFVAMDRTRTRVWSSEETYLALLSRQEPQDPAVQLRAIDVDLRNGRSQEALRRAEMLASAGWEDQEKVRYWYARALLAVGRIRDARLQLAGIWRAARNPNADLSLVYAEAAARDGDLAAARVVLERAAREFPDEDAIWNGRGNVAWMSGDAVSAAGFYREALRLNPQNEEALANLRSIDRMTIGKRAPGP